MEGINLIALFDHEEIGSHTKQGAGSILLHDMLRRILKELGREQTAEQDLYRSMLLSVDVAHGIHPNQAGKMDLTNKPVLGRGFCIKEASSQSYATDCEAIAIIQQICEKEKIAYQKFVNRSGYAGGKYAWIDRFRASSGEDRGHRNPASCHAFREGADGQR